jgi:sRNA-binding carbon storage regulator CsrA
MALQISRKKEQVVEIGEAKVRIVKLSGSRVVLEIDAPKTVKIVRDDCKKSEGKHAA